MMIKEEAWECRQSFMETLIEKFKVTHNNSLKDIIKREETFNQ